MNAKLFLSAVYSLWSLH